jgi:hypothetical protein
MLYITQSNNNNNNNYKTFNIGNNITCNINCKYRIVAKLYNLQTWFQVYNYIYRP